MFHPLSYINTKTPFCCIGTVANNALNCWSVVVFDWLWANTVPTLITAFSLTTKCSCKMVNKLPSDIFNSSAILSNLFMIGQNEFVEFFGVFQDSCQIWATWTFGIICVCTTTFKISIPPLNHCFWRSTVWITLIKPLLCLNSIFSHQKAMFYQHMKFRFFHCFENLQQ